MKQLSEEEQVKHSRESLNEIAIRMEVDMDRSRAAER